PKRMMLEATGYGVQEARPASPRIKASPVSEVVLAGPSGGHVLGLRVPAGMSLPGVVGPRPSAAVSTCRPPAAGCGHKWWVKGWEMCRSYQNCASRRDWHGHGSQAAQPTAAQLILVLPSAVCSSTGRCAAAW